MLAIYDSEGAFMQSGKTCAYLLELSILFKRSGSLGRGGREDFCGQGFIKKSAPVVKPPPAKPPKKSTAKTTEKKGKTVEVVKEEKLDPLAEKLCQQRLVEEADFRSTTELFAKKGDEKSLDSFIPKSESDFLEYAELISHKLRSFEVCKRSSASVSAIANKKIKAEKEANAGKKKQARKRKQLHVDKPEDDLVINPYDTLDDYDFMKSVSACLVMYIHEGFVNTNTIVVWSLSARIATNRPNKRPINIRFVIRCILAQSHTERMTSSYGSNMKWKDTREHNYNHKDVTGPPTWISENSL
ncbi:EUKARYOTIC TRANSLATION INITIATION FACTOR 3 SUBUNIT J [Salix purpurea]|uniref:EUKARYOTIC TRANSLATION INITIATION FACTOR 3 SUBUNIT J n=1 Tax=Salix purpurea TaxID=77065 RepID=A0A9Q0URU3_SALPP|nr:EUKARYOTIC TRANSLATION INITIATION FACTOR 3 SUBUNIT J [Salix purpurea]